MDVTGTRSDVSEHYLGQAGVQYADFYLSDPNNLVHELNLNFFIPYLRPTDFVLDFGCGNGGMLRLLTEYVQRADGLEVNPHVANVARSTGLAVYSCLSELPRTPTYNAIVSNHVLEHVRDVPTTLERLRASILPGGLLVLKLPMEDWRAKDQRQWSKNDINHHLQTWTPKLIGNVLYEAGYEVDDIQIVTAALHPKLFRFVKWGLGGLAFWALALFKKRRQLLVVGRVPV